MTIHGHVPKKPLPDGYCEHWQQGWCYHPRADKNPKECTGFDQCLLLEQDALNQDSPPPKSMRNKNVRFELWHDGFRKNVGARGQSGGQDDEYVMVPAEWYYVGLSSSDKGEYFQVERFKTKQERADFIKSYKLFEVID